MTFVQPSTPPSTSISGGRLSLASTGSSPPEPSFTYEADEHGVPARRARPRDTASSSGTSSGMVSVAQTSPPTPLHGDDKDDAPGRYARSVSPPVPPRSKHTLARSASHLAMRDEDVSPPLASAPAVSTSALTSTSTPHGNSNIARFSGLPGTLPGRMVDGKAAYSLPPAIKRLSAPSGPTPKRVVPMAGRSHDADAGALSDRAGHETESGHDERQPPLPIHARTTSMRQRTNGIVGANNASINSSMSRPRRSASFSDAHAQAVEVKQDAPVAPPSSSAGRPGGVRRTQTASGIGAMSTSASAPAIGRASPTQAGAARPTHTRKDSETLRSFPHGGAPMVDTAAPVARDYASAGGAQTPTLRGGHRATTSSESLGPHIGVNGHANPPGLDAPGAGRAWDAASAPVPSASAPAVLQPPPAAPVAPRTIVVNKRVYHRLDLVGKGGTSRVYRVMSDKNEILAIKRVALDRADEETIQGYRNEISLLKRLEGNNRIIRLVDSETRFASGGKGSLLIVMECGEIDLARLLQEQLRKPLNLVWVAYYWQQMLEAVHVIHEEKIVHSDLKPANFVLVRGQLKLIDFGIANAIANDTTNIQRDHQIGTVNYMSPEAIEVPEGMRRLKVGRQSDVWSLGVILYQMVYGHPPFFHLTNVMAKMRAIPDPNHAIEFPLTTAPSPLAFPNATPDELDVLRREVRRDVVGSMQACLCRNPRERATIPDLLDHEWLAMKEHAPQQPPAPAPAPAPVPNVHDLLAPGDTIINAFFMQQLLMHGIQIGRSNNASMDDEHALADEAERLIAELQDQWHMEHREDAV